MRLPSSFLLIAAFLILGAAHAQQGSELWLSPDQIRRDIALAEEAYSRIHPGYTRYATSDEMENAWSTIIKNAEAENGMSLGAFYLEVEKALVEIRCDHTKAELPESLAQERRDGLYYLPFRWKLIEGRGFISTAPENTDLQFGDEILEIDGRSLAEMVTAVERYIPVDGYTDWARRGGVSESLEFMGGAVDHFGALIWDIAETAIIVVRDQDGLQRTVEIPRIGYDAWLELGKIEGVARNFKNAVTYERIDQHALYLRIDTFVNYRDPVNPEEVYSPIFTAMREEGRDTLILDLRNNGGGSTDASHGLVAFLIQEKMALNKDVRVATLNLDGLREHLWTWDKRALNPNPLAFRSNVDGTYSIRKFISDDLKTIRPKRNSFGGKLIILTSSNNSSGSTNLIATLDGLGRSILVGEKTGGSSEGPTAGILFTLTLPESGIKTRIPFFRYFNNVPEFVPGLGVSPDIEAPMTIEAFLEGRDPALEMARQLAAD